MCNHFMKLKEETIKISTPEMGVLVGIIEEVVPLEKNQKKAMEKWKKPLKEDAIHALSDGTKYGIDYLYALNGQVRREYALEYISKIISAYTTGYEKKDLREKKYRKYRNDFDHLNSEIEKKDKFIEDLAFFAEKEMTEKEARKLLPYVEKIYQNKFLVRMIKKYRTETTRRNNNYELLVRNRKRGEKICLNEISYYLRKVLIEDISWLY